MMSLFQIMLPGDKLLSILLDLLHQKVDIVLQFDQFPFVITTGA